MSLKGGGSGNPHTLVRQQTGVFSAEPVAVLFIFLLTGR
jgi:hypothetical protein